MRADFPKFNVSVTKSIQCTSGYGQVMEEEPEPTGSELTIRLGWTVFAVKSYFNSIQESLDHYICQFEDRNICSVCMEANAELTITGMNESTEYILVHNNMRKVLYPIRLEGHLVLNTLTH